MLAWRHRATQKVRRPVNQFDCTPNLILPCYRPMQLYVLSNGSHTYSQHTERHPTADHQRQFGTLFSLKMLPEESMYQDLLTRAGEMVQWVAVPRDSKSFVFVSLPPYSVKMP
ncbi:hypothetical protein STEG23_014963, partial [Scotinomys teguina]